MEDSTQADIGHLAPNIGRLTLDAGSKYRYSMLIIR